MCAGLCFESSGLKGALLSCLLVDVLQAACRMMQGDACPLKLNLTTAATNCVYFVCHFQSGRRLPLVPGSPQAWHPRLQVSGEMKRADAGLKGACLAGSELSSCGCYENNRCIKTGAPQQSSTLKHFHLFFFILTRQHHCHDVRRHCQERGEPDQGRCHQPGVGGKLLPWCLKLVWLICR